jgi:hypothetical protein
MAENERFTTLLNTYRAEIMAKSPKSLSIWQQNPGRRQAEHLPVGGSLPDGG